VSPYWLADDISLRNGLLTATIIKTIKNGVEKVELPLAIQFLKSGVARLTIDEKRRREGDIQLPEGKEYLRKERYNGVANAVVVGGKELDMDINKLDTKNNVTRIKYGSQMEQEVLVHHCPFKLEFLRNNKVEIVVNERNFFNLEHWRAKPKEQKQEKEGDAGDKQISLEEGDSETEEHGMWEESFGGKQDSKPRGNSYYHNDAQNRT
jgi:mannosyl-oligosaccharide alpha-1,3-glucosidase